ncbi:MAG: hypothetical protein ACJAR1_000767 [Rubritalea sp.]|jgi:hypothetical protein
MRNGNINIAYFKVSYLIKEVDYKRSFLSISEYANWLILTNL